MGNGRIAVPGMPPAQVPAAVLSTPFNDVQLIAMIAAQAPNAAGDHPGSVRWAADLVAEAVLNGVPRLQERLRQLRDAAGNPSDS